MKVARTARIRWTLGIAVVALLLAACGQVSESPVSRELGWDYGLEVMVEGLPESVSSTIDVVDEGGAVVWSGSEPSRIELEAGSVYRVQAAPIDHRGVRYLPVPPVQIVRVDAPNTPAAIRFQPER